jgi:hypothetical protein
VAVVVGSILIAALFAAVGLVVYVFPVGSSPRDGHSQAAGPRFDVPGPVPTITATSAPPPPYTFDKIGNLCDSVDVDPIKTIFEADTLEPKSSRSPSGAGFGSASCIRSLGHIDGTGLSNALVTLDYTVWVFSDIDRAIEQQKQYLDNAAADKRSPQPVPGFGEEAFAHLAPHSKPGPITDIEYSVEVRDANLRWIARINAGRIDQSGWSQKQQDQILGAVMESAKRGYAKVTGSAR